LGESEELHDFLGFRGDFVDTFNSDNQEEFGFRGDEEFLSGEGLSLGFDSGLLFLLEIFPVGLSFLEGVFKGFSFLGIAFLFILLFLLGNSGLSFSLFLNSGWYFLWHKKLY